MSRATKKANGGRGNRYRFAGSKATSGFRKSLHLAFNEADKARTYLSHASTGQTISDQDINQAVQTVRIRRGGSHWTVKKVANPKVWSFQNPDSALAKAIDLATPDKWSVVVHDNAGAVIKVISPTEFKKPLVNFRWPRFHSFAARRRQRSNAAVATAA